MTEKLFSTGPGGFRRADVRAQALASLISVCSAAGFSACRMTPLLLSQFCPSVRLPGYHTHGHVRQITEKTARH